MTGSPATRVARPEPLGSFPPSSDLTLAGDGGPGRGDQRESAHDLTGGAGLERISRLATALLGTPVSLVSLVEHDRQVFAAQVGLEEPWASRGETPLSHSFCQHVVADESALVIADARLDDRLRDNLAIDELHVIAYCGVPLRAPDGRVIGSFCVIDSDPREWTPEEVALVEDLGALAQTELAGSRGVPAGVGTRALAHDMRSTLHGVIGGARTLGDHVHELDEDQREQLLAVVERQAGHLEELVEHLLDGGAAGRWGIGVQPVGVRTLLRDLVEERRLTGTRGVELAPGREVVAMADPTALRRCLTNLVDNALKHGGPDTRVVLHVEAQPMQQARISVADDGPGIPSGERERVFERGHRATAAAPGLGLGLATVRHLAREMQGDVHLAEDGPGATFVVTLPVA